jgi:hypothetical protein
MSLHSRLLVTIAVGVGLGWLATSEWATAQPPGEGPPPGKGMNKDATFMVDRDVFHFLLDHRTDIRRTVKKMDKGVETLTESDKPDVAAKIQEHVVAMHKRIKEGKGIHLRDPLFAEIFRHYDKITMTFEKTTKGVKVETSDDRDVIKLIQAHAEVVSKFIENGYDEVHKNHEVPNKKDIKKP